MVRSVFALAVAGLLVATPCLASPQPDVPPGQEKKQKKKKKNRDGLGGLDLTEQQREAVQALRKQINEETVGNNKVAQWHLRQRLKELTGERGRGDGKKKREKLDDETRTQVQALKQQMAAMKTVIKEGQARFRAGVDEILTDAQKAQREERKANREARPKGDKKRAKAKRKAPGQDRKRFEGITAEQAASHGIFWHPKGKKKGKKGKKGKNRSEGF